MEADSRSQELITDVPSSTRRAWAPTALACCLGAMLSVVVFTQLRRQEDALARQAFERAAADRVFDVRRRIEADLQALLDLKSFHDSSQFVDQQEFRSFVTPVLKRDLGVRAFEWIPRVPGERRGDFEREMATRTGSPFRIVERSADGELVPAGPRTEHFPVSQVEPLEGNRPALGFDLASNPTRLRALADARDQGRPCATPPLRLVPEGDSSQVATLIVAPLYEGSPRPDTLDERRRRLTGFVLAVVAIRDLVKSQLELPTTGASSAGRVELELHDELSPGWGSLLDASQPAAGGSHLRLVRRFEVAGRPWRIEASASRADWRASAAWVPISILLGGLALTGLLGMQLFTLLTRRDVIERLASVRAEQLREQGASLAEEIVQREAALTNWHRSEQRAHTIVEAAVEGILSVDGQGQVTAFNPAAERIFARSAAEIIGRPFTELLGDEDARRYLDALRRHLADGSVRFLGQVLEVEARRGDGTGFPAELTVTRLADSEEGPAFAGFVRDVSERRRIERLKSEFVATVSHELRTPLTSIVGALGILKGGVIAPLPEELAPMVEIARANGERLTRLVNDLLDIEKIESGSLEFRSETLDLGELVRATVAANKAFAARRGVDYLLDDALPSIQVKGDRSRLEQVLTNLLSNAAKFSPEGGDVRVLLSVEDDRVRVTVEDRGSGIPEEFQPRVFERFSQADASDARQLEGTGLGLSIAKGIVERHGGRIGFDPRTEGGTSFWFELPVLAASLPLAPPSLSAGAPRVLACEEDPDAAELLELILGRAGFHVDLAISAEDAERLLAEGRHDALTLDLGLPGGIELVRRLRRSGATAQLPIIVLSARSPEARRFEDELEGHAVSLADWLVKPVAEADLVAAVRRAVSPGSHARTRVLHVEDDAALATVVGVALAGVANVDHAATLADARARLSAEHYDIVILDLGLPDGRGELLLPVIGALNGKAPEVVLFSANEPTAELASSVASALVKARTTPDELASTVRALLAERQEPPSKPSILTRESLT